MKQYKSDLSSERKKASNALRMDKSFFIHSMRSVCKEYDGHDMFAYCRRCNA